MDLIRVGELLISRISGAVLVRGEPLHLTPGEFRILVALAERQPQVISRETLGQLVWGYQDLGTGHLIDVHAGRLRLKLRNASASAPIITTVPGVGYVLRAADA